MNDPVYEKTENTIIKQIGIPLFECCLALCIARNTVENLAQRSDMNEFAMQLNHLAGLLATCGRQLAKLTDVLPATRHRSDITHQEHVVGRLGHRVMHETSIRDDCQKTLSRNGATFRRH
jgi:hypothetical protein